jgi:putative ABC transport system ATP-binding protein
MEKKVDITRARNKTLLIVTHDLEIASYADRIVRISDGNIVEDTTAPPTETEENL